MTISENRFEVGSDAWLTAVHEVLESIVTQAGQNGLLDGIDYSMCEVYTHVPSHVSSNERVAWHFRVRGNSLHFSRDEAHDVDVKVTAEWAAVAPYARLEIVDGTEESVALNAGLAAAIAAGRMQFEGDPRRRPAVLAPAHNLIARRSL